MRVGAPAPWLSVTDHWCGWCRWLVRYLEHLGSSRLLYGGRHSSPDMAFIAECIMVYVLVQAVRHPASEWENALRWATGRQVVTPVAALPEAPKPRARRTRKAAA